MQRESFRKYLYVLSSGISFPYSYVWIFSKYDASSLNVPYLFALWVSGSFWSWVGHQESMKPFANQKNIRRVLYCDIPPSANRPDWCFKLTKLESDGLIILYSHFLHSTFGCTTAPPREAHTIQLHHSHLFEFWFTRKWMAVGCNANKCSLPKIEHNDGTFPSSHTCTFAFSNFSTTSETIKIIWPFKH